MFKSDERDYTMTKQKGNYADAAEDTKSRGRAKPKTEAEFRPFRWCNVSLSADMKEEIRQQEFDAVRIMEWLEALVNDRYKVTISYDEKSDSFMVVVVGKQEGAPDFNTGVSSRHNLLTVALLATRYKFDVLFMGGAIPTESVNARNEVFD